MLDCVVVGGGMFGASAAAHLAEQGAAVGIIGSAEPPNPETHTGPFAAHYDRARITRRVDTCPAWGVLAEAGFDLLGGLVGDSGIAYAPVGCLHAAALPAPGLQRQRDVVAALSAPVSVPGPAPFRFPAGTGTLLEGPPAGWFDPRAFVADRLQAVVDGGGEVVTSVAVAVEHDASGVTVAQEDGRVVRARTALIATGAFSSELLDRPLDLTLKTETVAMGEVAGDERAALADLPCLVYDTGDPSCDDVYVLPPVRYPDGKWYVKMGANTPLDRIVDVPGAEAWYREGDGTAALPRLRASLEALLPHVAFGSWQTRRCVITRTAHGMPYVDTVVPGRVFVAVGGNGKGAKAAAGVGRLAAGLVLSEPWPEPRLDPSSFRAVYR